MKNCFIRLSVVFSLFVNVVPSYAMISRCEIEDESATNVTIRCNTMTRCSYTCPTNSEWDTWKSNLVYAVGGVFFGLVVPKLPVLYNYVRLKWDAYWGVRAAVELVEPGIQTTPQPQESTSDNAQHVVSLVSSVDGSGPEGDGAASTERE